MSIVNYIVKRINEMFDEREIVFTWEVVRNSSTHELVVSFQSSMKHQALRKQSDFQSELVNIWSSQASFRLLNN